MAEKSSQTPSGPRYLSELKSIRTFSVIAVVLFNTSTPGFAAGYLGVDIFFVLSGFLVTSLLLAEGKNTSAGTVDLIAFYSKRVRRLVPAATAVLLCTAVALRLAVDPLLCEGSTWSFLSAAYYLANWYVIATEGWDRGMVSPVQHYWALSVEQQFYLFYPLLLMGFRWLQGRGRGTARGFMPLLAGVPLCLASLVLAAGLRYADEGTASSMMTLARLYQLVGGCLLAMVAPVCVLPPFVASLGLLGMATLLLSSGMLSPLLGGILAFITSALLILGLESIPQEASDSSWTKRFLSLTPLKFVGECSYCMYLVHFPMAVIGDAIGLLPTLALPLWRSVFMVSSSLALGCLLHKLVESPSLSIQLDTRHRSYGVILCIFVVPILVTAPLMTVLSPTAVSADFVKEPSRGSATRDEVGPVRFVTIGDSHCVASSRMMKAFFSDHDISGRVYCQNSFPATSYPNYSESDADFLDKIIVSLLTERTDYLVVWNMKNQFACVYKGKTCSYDSSQNDVDSVNGVRDRYEPGIVEFFAHLLPYVNEAVLIMLPEPIAPFNPQLCLSESVADTDCDWDLWHMPGYEAAVSAYEAVAQSTTVGGPQVILFNPDELLCPNGRCHAVDGGTPLYKNPHVVAPTTWMRLRKQVEQLWEAAGVSFAPRQHNLAAEEAATSDLANRLSERLRRDTRRAILGDYEKEFEEIMAEFYEDLLPYMQRATLPSYEEYDRFARQFRANRERAASIRPNFRHVSAAMVTSGTQLVRNQGLINRTDLCESIVIPIEDVEDEFSWALAHHFRTPATPPHWPSLYEGGCTEENIFCLSKPWLSLAIALETDLICLWEPEDGWAADYGRLLEYDVLMILDYRGEQLRRVLSIVKEAHFEGSIFFMPSESRPLSDKLTLSSFDVPGACSVILDNYWSIKDDVKAHTSFYPLWFKYPLDAWLQLNSNQADDPWLRREVFVARLTGRPSESEQYVQERREAASFFSEIGYSVNDEADRLNWGDYYAYFGRCKYAFLPIVSRNSTGQIIADALVSSNFTIIPFSYGHKLWMRVLPPFLTISSVAELKEKIEFLDANEAEYRSILTDIKAYAPAFADERLGETAAEVMAALAASSATFSGVDFRDCLRLPSLSIPS